MSFTDEKLLILDGACGTAIHAMDLPPSVWEGHEDCNEYLNLSAPEAIVEFHAGFLDAGCMVLETNTFGASRIVLAEFGLADRVEEINRAAVANARGAIAGRPGRYVAGSMGPTTKLPSLGHIPVSELHDALGEQARALLEAGVDALIIETCQDLLQVKTALTACFDAVESSGRNVPIMVSVTIERQGTMLVGSDIAAVAATLEPFPIFSLGLNCATGPTDMESHIRYLSQNWPGRISCIPNQGLPEVRDGQTIYPLTPEEFAQHLRRYVEEEGISIVGGCCGSTPAHMRCLAKALEGATPKERGIDEMPPRLASQYQAVDLTQDIPPTLIGERANPNGSRAFRERLLDDDYDACLKIGLAQETNGAQLLDLCVAYAGRDELADLTTLTRMYAQSVKAPIAIDSTSPECVAQCLARYPGRCLINSIHLEDGGKNLGEVCRLAKRHGAAVVALTINEQGMAMTADEKVATAKRIHDLAVHEYGLRPKDILFDALTFTVGSGDKTLRDAALQTLEGLRRIKAELPGVLTVLGVSNISFGLPPHARKLLNAVFLHEAVEAGLDAVIIDAIKVVPVAQIAPEDLQVCQDLLHDTESGSEVTPLMRFIEHFGNDKETESAAEEDTRRVSPEKALHEKVVRGDKEELEDLLAILLRRTRALDIVNQVLVPAMRHVGEMFGRGELLLPFVLQSAEVMKRSVDFLEPYMDKTGAQGGVKILLATVQGDVHDIGKNLVDIILSNNGYTVYNIGIKATAENIIAKAREHNVDIIGLSGLLVKSAIVMQESMAQYKEAQLGVPILLGGAALTPKFVAESCVPEYDQPVVYCTDAFAGLKAVREFEAGTLKPTSFNAARGVTKRKPGVKTADILPVERVPEPPFTGLRHVTGIDPELLFPYLNEQALFRGRWGYRRGKTDAQEYEALIENTVRPIYEKLKAPESVKRLLEPKVAYGYFPCHSKGDTVYVEAEGKTHEFPFPRQAEAPHRCIADYFKTREEGGDIAGFFVATIGEAIDREAHNLFDNDNYHDYLVLHGFSVEVTDALAEYWHEHMRHELGISKQVPSETAGYATQEYQGSRYGFGYPACPDLAAQAILFEILRPEKIGVTLTENMEMLPEQSTSAIIVHHPQAKYFAV